MQRSQLQKKLENIFIPTRETDRGNTCKQKISSRIVFEALHAANGDGDCTNLPHAEF
jgi:hypothetical protein